MRNFRMKMRILNLPSCPDWRKVRVGSSADEDEIPKEWEMEQSALDKLAFKRQASLVKLNEECLELQKQLAEEDITVSTTTAAEFLAASKSFDDAVWPSPAYRTTSGVIRQSKSLQNIAQPPKPKSILHLSSSQNKVHAQRLRKLQQIRNELEDFAAVNKFKDQDLNLDLSLAQNFRESSLSFVGHDNMENGKQMSEISHMIQKRREKELLRARREVKVLEHKVHQQNDQEGNTI